jgi:hypothetical protein
MIMAVAAQTGVDPEMLLAVAQNESSFMTQGEAIRTNNPGNVGNTDSGATVTYGNPMQGLVALANNLKSRLTTN